MTRINVFELFKGFGTLTAGVLAAQFISVISSIFIARLYAPADFGSFSVFSATSGILAILLPLSFPLSITNASGNCEVKCLTHVSYAATLIMAMLSTGVLLVAEMASALPSAITNIYPTILLAPLCGGLTAFFQTQKYLLLRGQEYGLISGLLVMNSSVANGLKMLLGALSPNYISLVVATIFSAFIQVFVGWTYLAKRKIVGPLSTLSTPTRYLEAIKCNQSFPLYRMPQDLLATISQNLPILLLAAFFGPEPAAFYAICRLALEAPSRLVGYAVRDVLYSKIAGARRSGEKVFPYIAQSTLMVGAFSILPFTGVLFFGPDIFQFVFGTNWRPSGDMAQVVSAMFFLNIINKPSISAIPTLDMNKALLVYEIFSSGGRTVSFVIGFLIFESPIHSVLTYAVAGSFFYVALIAIVLAKARSYDSEKAS